MLLLASPAMSQGSPLFGVQTPPPQPQRPPVSLPDWIAAPEVTTGSYAWSMSYSTHRSVCGMAPEWRALLPSQPATPAQNIDALLAGISSDDSDGPVVVRRQQKVRAREAAPGAGPVMPRVAASLSNCGSSHRNMHRHRAPWRARRCWRARRTPQ